MADFCYFDDVFQGMHKFGPARCVGAISTNGGIEWVVVITKAKKQDNANGIVESSYDLHIYLQCSNIPLQGLDRHMHTKNGNNIRSILPI